MIFKTHDLSQIASDYYVIPYKMTRIINTKHCSYIINTELPGFSTLSQCPITGQGSSLKMIYPKIRQEMPGKCSLPPWVSECEMDHGTCVPLVPWCIPGSLTSCFLWSRWLGKHARHSRRMHNAQFYVSGKRPIDQQHWLKIFKVDSYKTLILVSTLKVKPLLLLEYVFAIFLVDFQSFSC